MICATLRLNLGRKTSPILKDHGRIEQLGFTASQTRTTFYYYSQCKNVATLITEESSSVRFTDELFTYSLAGPVSCFNEEY